MPRIQLDGVSFAHAGQPCLIDRLSLDLSPGITAVAGPNGAGKSTLLRLIAGELEPTHGVVRRDVACLRLLRQAPAAPPTPVRALAARWDKEAFALRSRFALPEDPIERWVGLSHGERQRWQLAAAWPDADALLLDEPTNHLDREGRSLLRSALRDAPGIVVLVSHDRALLDAVASQTLWLEDGQSRTVRGGYSAITSTLGQEREALATERQKLTRERRRLTKEKARRESATSAADAATSAGRRMKSHRDSDARSIGAKARVANAAAKAAQASRSIGSRVARLESELRGTRTTKTLGGRVTSEGAAAGRRFVFRQAVGPVAYGDRLVLVERDVAIARSERLLIRGKNGSGKSTLLRELVQCWPTPGLTYLPQELSAEERIGLLHRLSGLSPEARGRVLSRLASLGVDPERVLHSLAPSPGEARKLVLAFGLDEASEALALDEPENHLDAPSIERLEQLLADYGGAVVLITHDERLQAAIAPDRVIEL